MMEQQFLTREEGILKGYKRQMDSSHQFPGNYSVMSFSFLSQLHTHEVVEVCAKILYQVELNRGNLDTMWGFSVEAELVENSDKQDELCCYVSRVEERSVAMTNGESETGGRGKLLV